MGILKKIRQYMDNSPTLKPYLLMWLRKTTKTTARMNCDVTECTLFEDALYSIRTGKSIGMTCIGIDDYYCKIEGGKEV